MAAITSSNLRRKVNLVANHKNNAGRLKRAADVELQKLFEGFKKWQNFENTVSQIAALRGGAADELHSSLQLLKSNALRKNIVVKFAAEQRELQHILKKELEHYTTAFIQKNDLNHEMEVPSLMAQMNKNISRGGTGPSLASIMKARFVTANEAAIISTTKNAEEMQALARSGKVIFMASLFDVFPDLQFFQTILPAMQEIDTVLNAAGSYRIFDGNLHKGSQSEIKEITLILIDNGRSKILADPIARQLAGCIQCGICSRVCTISKSIGNKVNYLPMHNPVRGLLEVFSRGVSGAFPLLSLTTLSKNVNKYCPAGIDLQGLYIYGRKLAKMRNVSSGQKRWFYFILTKSMLNRKGFRLMKKQSRKIVMNKLYETMWASSGHTPPPAKITFNEYYILQKKKQL